MNLIYSTVARLLDWEFDDICFPGANEKRVATFADNTY